MDLGNNIKKIRIMKNISQAELAELAGINRVTLGNYERNNRIPNIKNLEQIAKALNVSVSALTKDDQMETLMQNVLNDVTLLTQRINLYEEISKNLLSITNSFSKTTIDLINSNEGLVKMLQNKNVSIENANLQESNNTIINNLDKIKELLININSKISTDNENLKCLSDLLLFTDLDKNKGDENNGNQEK